MRERPDAGRSCGQSLHRAEKGMCTGRHMKPHSAPQSFYTPVHSSPINTHGPSSLLWMLLLTPYCLNCFRVQKTILIGTCYTPGREWEPSHRTARAAEHGVPSNNCHSSIRKELAFKTQQKLLLDYLFFSPAVGIWEILNSSTKALAICCIYSELLPVLVICTPFRWG